MSDLLVIGPGHLGYLVAQKWRSLHPLATVTLKYRSHNQERAAKDEKEGFNVVSSQVGEEVRCQNVLFSAPPTGM
jgi:predicted dinucleotide-binding enzyme